MAGNTSHEDDSGSCSRRVNRRDVLTVAGAGSVIGLAGCSSITGGGGGGSPSTVQVADIVPLSGPWAPLGQRSLMGAEFAAQEINDNGGIEALDGAEIEVLSADAEDSVDTATSAAQDVISGNDLSGALGVWLSSFTIGVAGITEREGIPLTTQSYSDRLVNQGHEYLFKCSPLGSRFGTQAIPIAKDLAATQDVQIDTIAWAGDNTAASESFVGALRPAAEENNVDLAVDRTWTPPLSDATPVVEAIREAEPQIVFWSATATEDAIAVREKMAELDVNIPLYGNGTWSVDPSFHDALDGELLTNLMANESSHMTSENEDIVRRFIQANDDQPFMNEDAMNHYGQMYILKAGLEEAGSADPADVKDALHSITISEGQATKAFPPDEITFQDNGLMQDAAIVVPQWQELEGEDFVDSDKGVAPFTVQPQDVAQREVNWPTL